MLGVVIAGGESRRLGEDKAHVRLAHEPMWQRQLRVLQEAGAVRAVLIRRLNQATPIEVECWHDRESDTGPIAGLHAALAPQLASHVMVLAVDMPGITADWFRVLAVDCRPGVGAMVAHDAGYEPLAAIYPTEALEEIQTRLRNGEHSLQRLARALVERGQLIIRPAAPGDLQVLRGINTPADLAYWQSATAGEKESVEPAGVGPAHFS